MASPGFSCPWLLSGRPVVKIRSPLLLFKASLGLSWLLLASPAHGFCPVALWPKSGRLFCSPKPLLASPGFSCPWLLSGSQLPAPSSQLSAPSSQPRARCSQLPAPSSELRARSFQLLIRSSQLPAPSPSIAYPSRLGPSYVVGFWGGWEHRTPHVCERVRKQRVGRPK